MRFEHETRPSALTLEGVAATAKEVTLRNGFHPHTVLAQGGGKVVAFQPADVPPTYEQRLELMLRAGLALAARRDLTRLDQAFHICEAWMSMAALPTENTVPPSQDPKRKEVLMISRLQVTTKQVELITYKMRRDEAGKLIALEAMEQIEEIQTAGADRLLTAFVAGFQFGWARPYK